MGAIKAFSTLAPLLLAALAVIIVLTTAPRLEALAAGGSGCSAGCEWDPSKQEFVCHCCACNGQICDKVHHNGIADCDGPGMCESLDCELDPE